MGPKLSVILAVYNGMPYLPEAVESILGQTFRDYKLIIVDDGSTDGAASYLQSFSDARIQVIRQANAGQSAARNTALRRCKTEYVAVMDQDDISLPGRFAAQIDYLERHPQTVAVGTQIRFLAGAVVQRAFSVPTEHHAIERLLLRGQAGICHPSLMFRTAQALKAGGYPEGVMGEDISFCLRMSELGRIANLGAVEFHYRLHPAQASVARNMDLVRANHYAAYAAICRRQRSQAATMDEFIRGAAFVNRWGWWAEAQSLSNYRKGRIELASGRRVAGIARLGIAGVIRPGAAVRRVMQMALKDF